VFLSPTKTSFYTGAVLSQFLYSQAAMFVPILGQMVDRSSWGHSRLLRE